MLSGSNQFKNREGQLQKLRKVTDNFANYAHYSIDIIKLIGGDSNKFDTLQDLEDFLKNEENRRDLGEARAQKLDEAVASYEAFLVDEFKREVKLPDVRIKLNSKMTSPKGEVTQLTDLVAITQGLENARFIVLKEAKDLLEELKKDKHTEERRKALVLHLFVALLNVVNAGIAVEMSKEALNEILSHKDAILAIIGAESLKYFAHLTHEEIARAIEEYHGKELTDKFIDQILELIWDISKKFIGKNIQYSLELDKPLTDDELFNEIEAVRSESLLAALKASKSPQAFKYQSFVAKEIANKMQAKNEKLLAALQQSYGEAENEAKSMATLEGHDKCKAVGDDMLEHYHDSTVARDYYKIEPKFKYQDVTDRKDQEIPGYKLTHRACDNTYMYFPLITDPEVMPLLQPKPPKLRRQLTDKMHIGGRHVRAHIYENITDLHDPVYGFKEHGKYKHKDRIRDTMRASYIIQTVISKTVSVQGNPHAFLPFPTFKSAQEMSEAVIKILTINPSFRGGNYAYEEKNPHPTPLYLLTHWGSYKKLLDKPRVKALILEKVDANLILQSLTDLNVRGIEDLPRMMQVLEDTFTFLKEIGYRADDLEHLRAIGLDYIKSQCANPHRITRMKELTKKIENSLACSGQYDLSDQFDGILKQKRDEIDNLIKVCEELRKTNGDPDRIQAIEEIIVSYLTPIYHCVESGMALDSMKAKLLSGDDFTSAEKTVIENLKKDPRSKCRSKEMYRDVYNLVKDHIDEQEGLNQLKTFQNTFLTSQDNNVPNALTHVGSKGCSNDSRFEQIKSKVFRTRGL